MRWGLAVFGCFAIVLASATAFADATQCSKDAEDGQRLKAAGHLRDAREKFLTCSAPACPQIVQKDCSTWASEVLAAMPSIVIDAKDANGGDLAEVTVYFDDKLVTSRIDGKAIPIDPGPHKLRFERKGYEPVTQDIIAKEGVRSRVVTVGFTRLAGIDHGPKSAPPPPPPSPPPPSPAPPDKTSGGASKIPPIVVMSLGAVPLVIGIILVATAPALPPGCVKKGDTLPAPDPTTGSTVVSADTCGRLETDPQVPDSENQPLAERQKEAGRSQEQPVYGAVLAVGGGVLIVGGLVWYLLLPSGKASAKATPKFTPWIARESGGLMLGGTF